ncbi:hypothetical protein [Novosphingobium mangrovi (ex Huang et al. 2023)]|uniref:Uncharacterized protein n=1 Tax=Novosphingobium mangrovi (ex Huang et al. 2023) TaxID=2976432 RepID=A0ABT2I131_9SPHN|nr:hypothetical protein [Novosphingobium mangrovi (ex Huang et al. 2023)]MCT2398499.1 hypothetical protein [Novosphingobium mangrovi (ex Huang et al. 2023)]
MLDVPTDFPAAGSYGYIDDRTPDGRDVVQRVRIQQHKADGDVLVSLVGRRFPREVASGNRSVPLTLVRETEHPSGRTAPAHPELVEGSGRTRGRKVPRSTGAKRHENRR